MAEATKRYYVRLPSGSDLRVEDQGEAEECVELGRGIGWWSGEPFSGAELEHGLQNEPEKWIGRIVNLGGKSGGLWERVTITGYECLKLSLEGGYWVRNVFVEGPVREPLKPSLQTPYAWDIARGVTYVDYEVPQ